MNEVIQNQGINAGIALETAVVDPINSIL